MDIEAAAALGFKRDVTEQSLAILEAAARPSADLAVAMDLARYMNIGLGDATWALVGGRKALRRLGLTIPADADPTEYVAKEAAGQAEAYAGSFFGSMDVREAQGHTFTAAFKGIVAAMFGPR